MSESITTEKEHAAPEGNLRESSIWGVWRELAGDGKVLVKRRGPGSEFRKTVVLRPEVKARLDAAVAGSHTVAIEALIDYALSRLAEEGKDLEV